MSILINVYTVLKSSANMLVGYQISPSRFVMVATREIHQLQKWLFLLNRRWSLEGKAVRKEITI